MSEQKREKREFKILEIEGVAFYAKVHKPEVNKFNPEIPPQYSIEVVVNDKTAKLLKAEGLTPAKKEIRDDENDTKSLVPKEHPGFEGQKVFKFFRKTIKSDGSPNSPLPVVDSQLLPVPSRTLIGNGSGVVISINPWTTKKQDKVIHGANLLAVQVLNLVPYTAQEQKLSFKKREGFIADSKHLDPVLSDAYSSGSGDDEEVDF